MNKNPRKRFLCLLLTYQLLSICSFSNSTNRVDFFLNKFELLDKSVCKYHQLAWNSLQFWQAIKKSWTSYNFYNWKLNINWTQKSTVDYLFNIEWKLLTTTSNQTIKSSIRTSVDNLDWIVAKMELKWVKINEINFYDLELELKT